MKKFGSKEEVRLRFRLRMASAGLLMTRRKRMVNVSYVMKVLWMLLCILCCTLESLLVIKEDFWV